MPNLPNFNDLPDGSLSINHTGEDFWVGIDMDEMSFSAEPTPPPPLTLEEAFRRHAAALPPTLPAPIRPAPPYPEGVTRWPAPPQPPPQTATQVNEAQRTARVYSQGSSPFRVSAAEADCPPSLAPYPPEPFVQPERRPRARRLRESDPDAAIRKDPNAWSLKEAIELCKLLEVVLPEAGFHIALTGGLLHKEGKQKDCDLLFYQVRGAEPNYEILWKYLTVAGVIRSPSFPENGWLVKATYRGKAIDCLFPNAKKKKVAGVFAGPGPSNPASPE